jgi:gliding motility-associated-like protein
VIVNKDCYIDIPNSFTPNNDGVNDYFFPRQLMGKSISGFSMKVFNRWGQVIFETTKTDGRGWDGKFNGKDQPSGVYIYQMQAILDNGKQEEYTGNVTLLR